MAMRGLSFDIIIRCPTMKLLENCIDLGKHCFFYASGWEMIDPPLNIETPKIENPDQTDSDDFTSENDSSESE